MTDAPERTLSERIRIGHYFDRPMEARHRLADEVAALEQELTQKLACIQILAQGDEPNIVSEFPAANDVRRLAGDKRALEKARDDYIDGLRHELTQTKRLRAAIRDKDEALEVAAAALDTTGRPEAARMCRAALRTEGGE